VVIHAYYPELLDEILALLTPWQVQYRMIVTTAPKTEPEVRARLARFGLDAESRLYENRGRDILPFLRVANELADDGEELLVKLHTKRSLHRPDRDVWRRDLLTKLVGPENAQRLHGAFSEFPRLGMIAPEGHILTMRSYWGANQENVHYLCRRLGIAQADPTRYSRRARCFGYAWTRSGPCSTCIWTRPSSRPKAANLTAPWPTPSSASWRLW
jgi:lipopolysaccharide biosynthesis protein